MSGIYIIYNNLECIKDNLYDMHGLKLFGLHFLKLIHLFNSYKK